MCAESKRRHPENQGKRGVSRRLLTWFGFILVYFKSLFHTQKITSSPFSAKLLSRKYSFYTTRNDCSI